MVILKTQFVKSRRMASDKPAAGAKPSSKTNKRKRLSLGPGRAAKAKEITSISKWSQRNENNNSNDSSLSVLSAAEQLSFLLDQYQSANGIRLSSLELESLKDTCILKLSEELNQDASNLGEHMKAAFGSSWKEVLSEGQLVEGKIDPGSPTVLVICSSAMRSLEFLRGLWSLTKECHAVKLFSKHIKVEDQVSMLKNRVNIASGTPSRIKKLCEMEALGLSRLKVIVLDLHTDAKGYSLFTLPQVRDEFWDLYKNYFHQLLVRGILRVCMYGSIRKESQPSSKKALD
ncbi:hypothetical protein Nepgr_030961 [Nepenthes gracilis]|uniref:Protein CMSS1 n=1 Tax=Nepenthes gracilis TaxID=150966 RepID=A0AAD3TFR3_NEPGR|nr:hypothetical protein Nepgr_030961 [Nepenthes gracilis]